MAHYKCLQMGLLGLPVIFSARGEDPVTNRCVADRKGHRKGLLAGLEEARASNGTEHVGGRRLGRLGLGLRLTLGARCFVLGEWVQMENVLLDTFWPAHNCLAFSALF